MIGMAAGEPPPKVARFAAPHTLLFFAGPRHAATPSGHPLLVTVGGGLRERQYHLLAVVGGALRQTGLVWAMSGLPPVSCLAPTKGLPQRSSRKIRTLRVSGALGGASGRSPGTSRRAGRRRVGSVQGTFSSGVLLPLGGDPEPARG